MTREMALQSCYLYDHLTSDALFFSLAGQYDGPFGVVAVSKASFEDRSGLQALLLVFGVGIQGVRNRYTEQGKSHSIKLAAMDTIVNEEGQHLTQTWRVGLRVGGVAEACLHVETAKGQRSDTTPAEDVN